MQPHRGHRLKLFGAGHLDYITNTDAAGEQIEALVVFDSADGTPTATIVAVGVSTQLPRRIANAICVVGCG
jgi:hypothetical protein